MSDVPMHPQPPSHGDNQHGQPTPADRHGQQFDAQHGAHQEDQSWLLDDGPDPVLEPMPYEAVHALPQELEETALEGDGWLGQRADEDLIGEAAPVEPDYEPEDEEAAVGASYVEPEPRSRPFTRALMPGVAALLVSFGGIALWSALKNPGGIDGDVQMADVDSNRDGGPGGRRGVELAQPLDGQAITNGSGRMSVQDGGKVVPVGGVTAPSIGATATVDQPREPGELPPRAESDTVAAGGDAPSEPQEAMGVQSEAHEAGSDPAMVSGVEFPADAGDDSERAETVDEFGGDAFDGAESVAATESGSEAFDFAELEGAFGDIDDWDVDAGPEVTDAVAAEGPVRDDEVVEGDELVQDEEQDEDPTNEWDLGMLEVAAAETTNSESEAVADVAAEAAVQPEGIEANGDEAVAAAAAPELDFEPFVEETDPLARALEQFAEEPVAIATVERDAPPPDAMAPGQPDDSGTLASVSSEITGDEMNTTVEVGVLEDPLEEPGMGLVFGPEPPAADIGATVLAPFEEDAPGVEPLVAESATDEPDADGTPVAPERVEDTDVALAMDEPVDAAPRADAPQESFELDESQANARLDAIFGDLTEEAPEPAADETLVAESETESAPEISDVFPAPTDEPTEPTPGDGSTLDFDPVDHTAVEAGPPAQDAPVSAEPRLVDPAGSDSVAVTAPVTDQVVLAPVGPDPLAPDEMTPEAVGTAVAMAEPMVPNTGGPVAADGPQYPGQIVDETTGPTPAEKAPVEVEVRENIAGDGPKKRGGVLTLVDDDTYWRHKSVPKRKFDNKAMVLTPNVGSVRVVFGGGESIDGRLHAVGQNKLVLDTKMGRMTIDARRADRVERITGTARTLRSPSKTNSTSGLTRVRVRAKGGTFYGHLVAQDGDKVTLLLDEGFRITVESTDVTEVGAKNGSRLRRIDDKKDDDKKDDPKKDDPKKD